MFPFTWILFSFLLCSKGFLRFTSHLLWSFSQSWWKTRVIFHLSFPERNPNDTWQWAASAVHVPPLGDDFHEGDWPWIHLRWLWGSSLFSAETCIIFSVKEWFGHCLTENFPSHTRIKQGCIYAPFPLEWCCTGSVRTGQFPLPKEVESIKKKKKAWPPLVTSAFGSIRAFSNRWAQHCSLWSAQ